MQQKPVVGVVDEGPATGLGVMELMYREALVDMFGPLVAGPSRPWAEMPEGPELPPVRPQLSARETDTLVLWLNSPSKQAVAHRMRLSPHTVEMYLRRARGKYQDVGRAAHTKADLLARAVEDGLIVLEAGVPVSRSVT